MKLITKDTDYALRALCALACSEASLTSVQTLVECLGVPHAFLRKILQRLAQKKIVRSVKGKGGGFALARTPQRLSVADIITIFQGDIAAHQHLTGDKKCCRMRTCRLKVVLDDIESLLAQRFGDLTIQDLL